MNINKANIANAIHSVAKDHVVAVANDIYDESREQYQSTLNESAGLYENNPEFIEVVTDNEGSLLYGVQRDGNFYFGAGVPKLVLDYVIQLGGITKEELITLIELEKDRAIAAEETKVDKEEGKSLINKDFADGIRYIENPEFKEIKLDNEDKILEAVMTDGTKLLPAGIKTPSIDLDGAVETHIDNPEFTAVWLTSDDRILFGLQRDGNFLFGCGIPSQIENFINEKFDKVTDLEAFLAGFDTYATLKDYLDEIYGKYIESPEFIKVELDAEDKMLEGTMSNGTKVLSAGVKTPLVNLNEALITHVDNPEFAETHTDSEGKMLYGVSKEGDFIDGKGNILKAVEAGKKSNNLNIGIDIDRGVLRICGKLYKLISYEGEADIDDGSVSDYSNFIELTTEVENPEFNKVITDHDDRLLYGHRHGGTEYETDLSGYTIDGVPVSRIVNNLK